MVQETWVKSQVASYQRLKKWYLVPPCLTLSNIRYISRVKWINPGKGVAPSPTPQCSNYWKGSLLIALDYDRQLCLLIVFIQACPIFATSYSHEMLDIGIMVRLFANSPGDLGSIPGQVIPKTRKMVLGATLVKTQHYKVRIKGKVEQSREGVASSPAPWCSNYQKGNLQVTLDYSRLLYLLYSHEKLE